MTVAEEKAALRQVQRERLARLGAGERRGQSERLLARLVEMPAWRAARRVALFAALGTEPEVDLLWGGDALAGKACVYPRVAGNGQMHLLAVRGLGDLQESVWGLREPPAAQQEALPLAGFDVILVPGVAFDPRGGRLGRGGGFYDRLLAGKRSGTLAIGVAFAFQVVEAVPAEAHDVKVDVVVTDGAGWDRRAAETGCTGQDAQRGGQDAHPTPGVFGTDAVC